MTYIHHRYYDSSLGRFITEDPAKDGLNWYLYCSHNPMRYVDPNGLWTFSFGFGAAGGVLGGGQVSAGLSISFSGAGGLQVGGYASIGGGVIAGTGGSISADFSVSGNDSISDTGDWSVEVGGTVVLGVAGVSGTVNSPIAGKDGGDVTASPVYTGSIVISTPAPEAHVFENKTFAGALVQLGGAEKEGKVHIPLPSIGDIKEAVKGFIDSIIEESPDTGK